MARYDVFAHTGGNGYLLDVQADLLDRLNTRIVVPLLPREQAPPSAERLNPLFQIDGLEVMMTTQLLSAVPASLLGEPVANLLDACDDITNALDMVFQGF